MYQAVIGTNPAAGGRDHDCAGKGICGHRRTQAALDAVAEAKRSNERARRAPTTGEMGTAVALFGTGVLAGSEWNDFHRMRSAGDGGTSSGDGGSSDSGGSGCGGCGS